MKISRCWWHRHDASQLCIIHADAGQERVEDEQTIFDLDEDGEEEGSSIWTKRERRRRDTAKMLQGHLMLQQCLPAPAPLLTQEAPWSTSACWIASSHGTSGNPKNDGGAKFEDRIIFISLCNDSDWRTAQNKEIGMPNSLCFCCVRQKSSQRTEEKL